MKKHAKQALERAEAMGLVCSITVGPKGHYKLHATKGNVSLDVPVSGTPTDQDACVNMVAQMLRRRFAERGVSL